MARRAPDRSRCFPFSIPASRPPPRFQRPRLRSFALPPTRAFPARNSVPLRQAATDGICVSGGSAESSARSGTDRVLCIGFTDRSGRAALPRRQNARSQILDAGLTLPDLCTRRVFCRFGAPSLLETGIDIGRVDSSSETRRRGSAPAAARRKAARKVGRKQRPAAREGPVLRPQPLPAWRNPGSRESHGPARAGLTVRSATERHLRPTCKFGRPMSILAYRGGRGLLRICLRGASGDIPAGLQQGTPRFVGNSRCVH